MSLTTNALPAAAAFGNQVVAAATLANGLIALNAFELGGPPGTWETIVVNGVQRTTDVAPAVLRLPSPAIFWVGIKGLDGNIYQTAIRSQGDIFSDWAQIEGVQTPVSPVVGMSQTGALGPLLPTVVALSTDGVIRTNVLHSDSLPLRPEGWKDVKPGVAPWLTRVAPAASSVEGGTFLYIAITSLDFSDQNLVLKLNQGGPFDGNYVGLLSLDFESRLAPAMSSSAGKRTVIVAADLDGHLFYNWWNTCL